ncbi:MAG: lysophospholipid acyltransferase family protein [Elusimicrobia bacterium]|nr:lysophospholipid acyltransferase family protein [Elusimicrobiota bacterium]
MKKISHVFEYLLVRLLDAIVSAPPLATAVRWGENLGALAGKIFSGRDRLMRKNLAIVFPEKSEAEIRAIADGVWRNLGRVAIEFIRSPEILPADLAGRVTVENEQVLKAAQAEGRGVIFVSSHFCNWEYTGIIINRLFGGMSAIARPMRNPRVERWVQSKRAVGGIPIILHKDAVRGSLRILHRKSAIGVLCDQNLYTGGVFVPFLGRLAATTTLPALLHARTDAPVVHANLLRDGGVGRYRLSFERVVFPPVANDDERLTADTAAVNRALEGPIRRHPELWFWVHNRWKRTPEPAVAAPAAGAA